MSVKDEEEYDQLAEDDDELSDQEVDPDTFFIENELEMPHAKSYTVEQLHGQFPCFFLSLTLYQYATSMGLIDTVPLNASI